MAADVPTVDLAAFPIVAPHTRLEPNEGEHTIRERSVCRAVSSALGLSGPLSVDANASYASLSLCGSSSDDEPVEHRIRVLGFIFGTGRRKETEYLGVSMVSLNAKKEIIAWSEDVQKLKGTPAYWAAVHAGKPPPPPKRGSLRDAGRLTFVVDGAPTEITPQIRELVAKLAPESPEASGKTAGKTPAKKTSAKKAPPKKAPAKKAASKKT
jgi:hypothetical protein